MFELAVFEQIRTQWIVDQEHPHRDRAKKPIPEIQDFRTLIEASFVASLKREEGRTSDLSVVLLPEEEKEGDQQEVLVFDTRLPLTPESLGKLAPAWDAVTSALVVSPPRGGRGDYEVWGVIFFGPTGNWFNEIAVHHPFSTRRPDRLIISVSSPGSLLISRGNAQIGRFVLGNFSPARPQPFFSRAMGSFIMSSLSSKPLYKEYGSRYWNIYRDALEYLLLEAATRRHGGTIIVMSGGAMVGYGSWAEARYVVRGSLRIGELIERILALGSDDILVDIAFRRALAQRLQVVAQLSCADGAVLLSDEFEPIAFGVTLRAPEWSGDVIVGPDGFGGGGESFGIRKLGTRHNSAANFIGACPSCYGFVLSQDGPIRGLIKKDEKTLYCWPDCTVSMFV